MASPEYVRSFMSAEIMVGVKRSDPQGIRHIKTHIPTQHKNQMTRSLGRHLSEEPSTYLK